MSFQHFRLHAIPAQGGPTQPSINVTTIAHVTPSSLSQALGAASQQQQQALAEGVMNQPGPSTTITRVPGSAKKGLYGSGDADDGYTLVFESMAAFQAWRRKEEEEKMVEFVKGDTHGSKAVPPRFKDHTKLVCARHTRSGRKKYVKKYPDRVRKVPSRKLEGTGCPASISYKTYYDTEEVRACYVSEHSHEIGVANLPYTRRGRKAAAEVAGRRTRSHTAAMEAAANAQAVSPSSSTTSTATADPTNPVAGQTNLATQPNNGQQGGAPAAINTHAQAAPQTFQSAIMTIAPPPQPLPQPQPQLDLVQERWDRMNVLFQGIRDHARTFDYPAPSVAALESVLIRLYLESPMGGG